MPQEHAAQFTVKISGPAVGHGRLAMRDVSAVGRQIEQAIQRIAQVLYGGQSSSQGRRPREIETSCRLYLVSWEPGSAIPGFALAEPPAQASIFGDVGTNSLKAFLDGIEQLSNDQQDAMALPHGFDSGVLQACDGLTSVLDHGIDELSLSSPDVIPGRTVRIAQRTRDLVRALLVEPSETGWVVKVGRLDVLNGHDGLTGQLWEADGSRWTCQFRPEHEDLLPQAWRSTVTLTGEVTPDNRLAVKRIALHGAVLNEDGAKETAFWRSPSLDELAAAQQAEPIDDLDALTAAWPEDEWFEDALEELMQDRQSRRAASRHGAA